MSTPRVPDSKVVKVTTACPMCRYPVVEVEAKTAWLELREKDGYIFTHSPKWKGVAVAILPFRKTYNSAWGRLKPQIEFLAVMESRPCHGGGEYISSITGAYDNSGKYSLEGCAMNELLEEGGYDGQGNPIISLDWVNGSKSGDGVDHLFAIEIPPDEQQSEPKGDGSAMEANVRPVWITAEQLLNSKDMILITMYARLQAKGLLK